VSVSGSTVNPLCLGLEWPVARSESDVPRLFYTFLCSALSRITTLSTAVVSVVKCSGEVQCSGLWWGVGLFAGLQRRSDGELYWKDRES